MRKYLLLGALMFAMTAWADQPPKLEPLPEIPPPPGMPDMTGMEPQVTITHKGQNRIEEFRIHGHLFMIKVTPSHGHPYYLIDQRGDGELVRYDNLSPNFQVPMWVIFQW